MKTVKLSGPSFDALSLTDAPEPSEPGHGQVLVRMEAASLNFIDLAVAQGFYPGVAFPITPVADGAGEVIHVGDDVSDLKVGDRVAIHSKAHWLGGRPTAEMARTMRGVTVPGSLREYACVDAATVVKAPPELSSEAIAALPIGATTAWNALVAANIGPGSTVALLGTGGVSLIALQLAKARGARVIITSSSDEKLERARKLGADEAINYRHTPEWDKSVIELTNGAGADLVIETVGTDTIARSLSAVRQAGTVFTVGFITGGQANLDLMTIIVKAIRVVGNNTGSVADLADAMLAISAAKIAPVLGENFSIADVGAAYRTFAGGGLFGKTTIRLDW